MSFADAWNEAETKVTEVPEGKHTYIIKNFNVKDDRVGLYLEFPKFRLKEWANFGSKGAGALKGSLKNIGALKDGLEESLKAALGRTGELEKTYREGNTARFANYKFLNGTAGDQKPVQASEDSDLPF